MVMKKLRCGRALSRLCLPATADSSCLCFRTNSFLSPGEENQLLLIGSGNNGVSSSSPMKLRDVIAGPPTLAFQLKPKMVVMRVAIHCNGCARKVQKHISKLEGVTSYEIDIETKMVVVTGDIVPFEVLESVSKVKNAQLWDEFDI